MSLSTHVDDDQFRLSIIIIFTPTAMTDDDNGRMDRKTKLIKTDYRLLIRLMKAIVQFILSFSSC